MLNVNHVLFLFLSDKSIWKNMDMLLI